MDSSRILHSRSRGLRFEIFRYCYKYTLAVWYVKEIKDLCEDRAEITYYLSQSNRSSAGTLSLLSIRCHINDNSTLFDVAPVFPKAANP
jgi:hypothetical protein